MDQKCNLENGLKKKKMAAKIAGNGLCTQLKSSSKESQFVHVCENL